MKDMHVDVAIIGAGTAGLNARRAALSEGASVVVIEGKAYGTTCARVGCMPSKLLIAAADAAHESEHAGRFGIETTTKVDGKAVMKRVKAERDRFVGFVVEASEKQPEKLWGMAKFLDDKRLQVGDHTIVHFKRVVIATGSRPNRLPFLNAVRERVIVNDDLFEWGDLPSAVAIFGAGVIGLELGQALARLGVRVRIFSVGGWLGPLRDKVVNDALLAALRQELAIQPDGGPVQVRMVGDQVEIAFEEDGERKSERFDYVLEAAGRRTNTDRIGLENTSFDIRAYDPRTAQLGDSHAFLAGDANGDRALLHEAADEGKIAGENAANFPKVKKHCRRTTLGVAFTSPQLAVVGNPHGRGNPVIGTVLYDDQGRARVMGKNRGALRVYADRDTGEFLGAELAAPSGEHLAHLLAWAHQNQMTIASMLAMPFYHPVVEEGVRTALRDALRQLGQREELKNVCSA